MPLSNFTLFFSDVRVDPCLALELGDRFRLAIPITPCVCR